MINTEKNIFELEKKLSEAYERIRELENVIAELKAGMMPSQTWKIDHNRNDEWLLDKDTITEQQSRIHRTKTVIDSSVIEELRIEKKDIQLKVSNMSLITYISEHVM